MSTPFFDTTGTCPPGHTTYSWTAPCEASDDLVRLAKSGHAGAAAAVASIVASPPPGHNLVSWTLGSESAAEAPADLVARVEALESLVFTTPSNIPEASKTANHARVEAALQTAGVAGACLFGVPSDYYDWTLAQRAAHLAAPVDTLCKTVLLENSAAAADGVTGSVFTSRYIAVVLQYVTKLDLPRLAKQLQGAAKMAAAGTPAPTLLSLPPAVTAHVTQPGAASGAGGGAAPAPADLLVAKFNFQVAPAEVSDTLSGYLHNAVTPFGMTTHVPVVITRGVAGLPTAHPAAPYVWLGGGEVDLKLRLPVAQLAAALGATEVNAAVPRAEQEEE